MGIHQLPNGRWRVQVRRRGRKLDKVVATEKEALECLGWATGKAPAGGGTVALAWEGYQDDPEYLKLSEHSKSDHNTHIKAVLAGLGSRTLRELEADNSIVRKWIAGRMKFVSSRTKRQLSNSTRRLEIHTLECLVKYGVQEHWCDTNFMRLVKRPRPTKRRFVLDDDITAELVRLGLGVTETDDRITEGCRFVAMLRVLAPRPGEFARAWRHDYNPKKRIILLRDCKDTRGGTTRDIPVPVSDLGADLIEHQLAYAKRVAPDSPYLFSTRPRSLADRASKHWVRYNYRTIVDELKEAGWLPAEYHAHSGRRSWITDAMERGMSHQQIGAQTGHRRLQSIEKYNEANPASPRLRAALAKHGDDLARDLAKSQQNADNSAKEPAEENRPLRNTLLDKVRELEAEEAAAHIKKMLAKPPPAIEGKQTKKSKVGVRAVMRPVGKQVGTAAMRAGQATRAAHKKRPARTKARKKNQ